MKRNVLIGGAAGGLAIALLLAWAFAPQPVPVEVAPVTKGRFIATIEEDGKTRLVDRFLLTAPLAGRLSRITLREGDRVSADQVVATLTPVLPTLLDDRTVGEQRARIESAKANVERTESRIARARVALEQSRNEWRRSEQLAQQGFIAPAKLEADMLSMRASQREVDSATADRNVANFELAQARAALGAVQDASGSSVAGAIPADRAFEVRSPIAGSVLRVLQTSAGTVPIGTALLELGDTSRLEIVAELLTTDALAAKPGSQVLIERWGGEGTLEGRVTRVEPAAFTKVSALGVEEQRVRVLIDLVTAHDRWQALGDGFRVFVRIIRIDEADAIMVPVSAVFPLPNPGAGASFAVFVFDAGVAHRVPVTVQARGAGVAWIRQGLKPGQQVIIYPSGGVEDGVRVAVRDS